MTGDQPVNGAAGFPSSHLLSSRGTELFNRVINRMKGPRRDELADSGTPFGDLEALEDWVISGRQLTLTGRVGRPPWSISELALLMAAFTRAKKSCRNDMAAGREVARLLGVAPTASIKAERRLYTAIESQHSVSCFEERERRVKAYICEADGLLAEEELLAAEDFAGVSAERRTSRHAPKIRSFSARSEGPSSTPHPKEHPP